MNARERTWGEYLNLAEHYKAIGQTEIFLFQDKCLPWHLANEVETGGAHRLGIPVSFQFRGQHSATGLTFRWNCDIEKPDANGSAKFDIDVERLVAIRSFLREDLRPKFDALLRSTARAVRESGDQYNKVAQDQYRVAGQLERLA